MAVDTTAEWLKQTLSGSEKMEALMLNSLPDDACGWENNLKAMWAIEPAKRPCGLLLTGPDGCGKHTIAAYMLNILAEEDFRTIYLSWPALAADSLQAAKARLDAILDHFYQEQWPMCLVLEQMEQCPCRQELLTFLGQTLLEYHFQQDVLPPLFLILIDQQEAQVPSILRRCLRLFRVVLPSRVRRMHYLEENTPSLKMILPLEQIAEAAEGMTFVQLRDLMLNLENLVDSYDGFPPKDAWMSYLEEQHLPVAPENNMSTLIEAVRQLLREIPDILRELPVTVGNRAVQPATVIPGWDGGMNTDADDEEPLTMDNVKKAPPLRLHQNIFTKEQQEALERAYNNN